MEKKETLGLDPTLGWWVSVRDVPHKQGFSYPVFEWSYGQKYGFRGGELRVWSLQGTLVFQDRRSPEEMPEGGWKFDSVEAALAKIDEYGWGKPPYIDAVLSVMAKAKEQFPVSDLKTAKVVFSDLKQRWEKLAATT